MVGNKALIASVSVAGFVGGFVVGYEAITQFGDALGPAGRALMVIVPAIIAAAAAVWMLMEGLTLGTATIALVASGIAVGAMVANSGQLRQCFRARKSKFLPWLQEELWILQRLL